MSQDEFVAYIRRSVLQSRKLYCTSNVLIILLLWFIITDKAVVSQEALHHTGV